MFGYTCLESIDVIDGFMEISDKIEIVKDEWGLAYLPAWGFSAIEVLDFAEGYQIKMIEEVIGFQFCSPITPADLEAAFDEGISEGAASVTPEDGITQADVDAAVAEVEASYAGWCASDIDNDGICDVDEVWACMNANSCNYNSQAEFDDGSCDYVSCLDECGVINGDNSSCTDECGVLFGDNSSCTDECGVPNGDNSSCTDECGVVNGDNSSCTDECGVVNGDNSTCSDCNGVPNGIYIDLGCGCNGAMNFDGSYLTLPTAAQDGYDCDGNILQVGSLFHGGYIFQLNEDGTGLVACQVNFPPLTYDQAQAAAQIAGSGATDYNYGLLSDPQLVSDIYIPSWSVSSEYSDWYIPDNEELELMNNTIGPGAGYTIVPGYDLPMYNIGAFIVGEGYWSTDRYMMSSGGSEQGDYTFNYSGNGYYGYGYYMHTNYTRVIRAF